MPWREQAFLSWAGLRGAVPIVLAMIPITEGVPGAEQLVDAVFVLVIVLTIVQGSTLPLVARMLGLAKAGETREVDVDAAPLDELGAVLLTFTHPRRLEACTASTCRELRLPAGATVSLLVRDGVGHTPAPTTRLQERDQLLVVATEQARTDDRAPHPRRRPRGPLRPLARRNRRRVAAGDVRVLSPSAC